MWPKRTARHGDQKDARSGAIRIFQDSRGNVKRRMNLVARNLSDPVPQIAEFTSLRFGGLAFLAGHLSHADNQESAVQGQ